MSGELTVDDLLVMIAPLEYNGAQLRDWKERVRPAVEAWQLTRVGDEERLRAALREALDWIDGGGFSDSMPFSATLARWRAALAPQPPSPASQGEEPT